MEKSCRFVYNLVMFDYKAVCFAAIILLLFPLGAAGENGCVQCHASLTSPALRQSYQDWKASVHSRSGITCEFCHQGDPDTRSKNEAHRPIYDSLNPKSAVYYTNIPSLCGGCHQGEYDAFTTSRHYRDFMTMGVGPNCVTCHDAMSTKIIKAEQIEIFCTVCHNAKAKLLPDVTSHARAVMQQLEATARDLSQAEASLGRAENRGMAEARAKGFLSLAEKEFSACKQDWHAFKLNRVATRLQGVENLIRKGREALKRS